MRDRGSAVLRRAAASLDATPDLVPLLADLFDGIEALGSAPRRIAGLLARAGIGRDSRVVDLGCGKGAVAIEAARRLGCRVVGVDALGAFVAHARGRAHDLRLDHSCEFVCAEIAAFSRRRLRRFDAAIMAGVAPIRLGAPILRRCVRPGGVYIIDWAFHDPRCPHRPDPDAPRLADSRALLERRGDTIERELVFPRAAARAMNVRLYARLADRSRAMARAHPRLASSLRAFLAAQRYGNLAMEDSLRCAIWVVRRGNGKARADGAPA